MRRDFASAEARRGLSDRPLHPFGFATTPNLVCIVAWGKTKGTQTNWSNDKDQLCKRAPKVSKGRSESPLVASAEAKPLRT